MKINKNRFLKWFLSLFSIFYFIFSLKIAKAEGVATIFTAIILIVAVIVMAPVLSIVAPWLMPVLYVAAGTTFVQAPIAFIVGYALTAGLIGVGVGEIQCIVGQNNIFFTGCEETPGSWGGQQVTPGSPTLVNEDYTATCNSISLTYDITGANQYGIYRSGNLINQGNASGLSKITYTDSNLTPHTTYQYTLLMTDDQGEQFQYPAINGYTKCSPQCAFSADSIKVVFPAKVTLSWDCQYADSCSISPTVGSVNAEHDQAIVEPTQSTDYILTCQNNDGSTSFSSSINVTNPRIKEIKP